MVNNYSSGVYISELRTIVNGLAREVKKWKHAVCINTYNDQVKRPPAFLKAKTCFIIIITGVASAKAGLVVGPLRLFVLTNGPSLGTLNFGNFLVL